VKRPQTRLECIRVIEIESSASFLQLHEAIQDAVDFDNDHLFQFYFIDSKIRLREPVILEVSLTFCALSPIIGL